MKSALVAAGVAVAVCAAYLGATAVSGLKVEKGLRAMTAGIQADWPMIQVTDEHYDRGLFAATRTFTLRPACEAPGAGASAPAAFVIVQHIKHGPFPGFGGFGAATVDTELALDAATRKQASELFGSAKPFEAHTNVAFSGATRTHFSVARFHVAGPESEQVDFQGLTGDVDHDDRALEYDVRMPVLSVAAAASSAAAVHMALTGMHLHARAEGTGDLALRPGKSQGEVQGFEVSVSAPDNTNAHKVAFSQIRFAQDTTLANKLMTATVHMDATGQVDDTKVDRVEVVSTIKRFDAATYQGIVRRLVTNNGQMCGKTPDPARLLASPEVQAAFVQMLSANPEVSLDKLSVVVDGKRAELGYALGVDGFTAADAQMPLKAALMTRAYANVRVKLPEAWVQKSMAYIAQQAGKSSGAQDQTAMVELMLGKMIDQGYVVREDDMLRTEAAYKAGRATVNGKPLGGPAAAPAAASPSTM